MSAGPLAMRFAEATLEQPEAGSLMTAHLVVENTGTIPWTSRVLASYHWLDGLGNPIVWDGLRTPLGRDVAPGEAATIEMTVRGPIPPGRYRFAADLVVEWRAWFSELGSTAASFDVDVAPRSTPTHYELPAALTPSADWQERTAAAHAEGYSVVAGAIDWPQRLLHRRPRALEQYRPGKGRVPGFPAPLICPSVVDGVELERLPDIAGLPAYAAPTNEPWIYDGRITLLA
ncbi:MAG: hypothetical protein F2663_09420 [Actinobacteria bacterium]|nr:hypothetical protein [Actinomycetota bacterium]